MFNTRNNQIYIDVVTSHGEGAEHLGQSIRELLVTLVKLQVNLSKIRRPVH